MQFGITYQEIDGIVDEQVDKPQEKRSVLVIDVELGVFGEMQKSVTKRENNLRTGD